MALGFEGKALVHPSDRSLLRSPYVDNDSGNRASFHGCEQAGANIMASAASERRPRIRKRCTLTLSCGVKSKASVALAQARVVGEG